MVEITGTSGNDTLSGTAGDDVIEGLEGSDTLRGEAGNDTLRGGIGNDTLLGGSGDDLSEGGDGDDALTDHDGGSDTMRGQGGNDNFFISRVNRGVVETIRIEGGDGNDRATYQNYNGGTVSIDTGIGDDHVSLVTSQNGATIALGAGRDIFELHEQLRLSLAGPIIVTDFETGTAGDRLE